MNVTPYLTPRRIILYSTVFISINVIYFLKIYGIDFSIFYSASHLALTGNPEMIYNIEVHHQVLEIILGRSVPYLLAWFYPPFFLLLVYPFALLPYEYSLYFWMSLTLLAYAFTIYNIAPHKVSVFLALGFPGVLMNLQWGQNGFLNTFYLGLGLYLVEINPIISGLLFAMLCYKPQYAFLPFLVLLIGRHWKTLFWSLFFLVTMITLSMLAFGFSIWQKYIASIPAISRAITNDWININAIQLSTYSLVRLLTGNGYWPTICQTIVSIMIIILVCWSWMHVKNHYLRCTILSTGVLLSTPYVLQYDLVLLAIPIAFFGWDVYRRGWLKGEAILLGFLYLLPVLNSLIIEASGFQITPIALIIFLIMTVRRIVTLNALGKQEVCT